MPLTPPLELTAQRDVEISRLPTLSVLVPFAPFQASNIMVSVGCNISTSTLVETSTAAVGCQAFRGDRYQPADEACNGAGCCQTALLPSPKYLAISIDVGADAPQPLPGEPGYVFVVENRSYSSKRSDIEDLNEEVNFRMVMEWAVRKENCSNVVGSVGYVCILRHSISLLVCIQRHSISHWILRLPG